jgi:hypothetical protein
MTHRMIASYLLTALLVSPMALALQRPDEPASEKASDKGPMALLDAGAEPRQALRYSPAKGAKGDVQMVRRMEMRQTFAGMDVPAMTMPPLHMVARIEVTDVADNGDISFTVQYPETLVPETPGVQQMAHQQMTMMLKILEGVTVNGLVSNRGQVKNVEVRKPQGLEGAMAEQVDDMWGWWSHLFLPVPEEPVGAGAKWEMKSTISQRGMSIRQTATYTLKEVKNGEMTLELHLTQEAGGQSMRSASLPPGTSMRLESYKGRGNGTLTQRLTDMFPARAAATDENDVEIKVIRGEQPQDLSQHLKTNVTLEPKTADSEESGDAAQ